MNDLPLENLKYDEQGLIPAVIQDVESGEILMLAYMNRESLVESIHSGETHFWSRSRKELWHKGAQSGNTQKVKKILFDCDEDALVVQVEQKGNACHTGERSCFFRTLHQTDEAAVFSEVLASVAGVIRDRKSNMPEGSYTTYLLQSGLDKILKKIGEESAETIIAAKNHNSEEIAAEVADLMYHLLVMLAVEGVPLSKISATLAERRGKVSKSQQK